MGKKNGFVSKHWKALLLGGIAISYCIFGLNPTINALKGLGKNSNIGVNTFSIVFTAPGAWSTNVAANGPTSDIACSLIYGDLPSGVNGGIYTATSVTNAGQITEAELEACVVAYSAVKANVADCKFAMLITGTAIPAADLLNGVAMTPQTLAYSISENVENDIALQEVPSNYYVKALNSLTGASVLQAALTTHAGFKNVFGVYNLTFIVGIGSANNLATLTSYTSPLCKDTIAPVLLFVSNATLNSTALPQISGASVQLVAGTPTEFEAVFYGIGTAPNVMQEVKSIPATPTYVATFLNTVAITHVYLEMPDAYGNLVQVAALA